MNSPKLLHHVFENTAKKMPENIAIDVPASSSGNNVKLTYSQIENLANGLAERISHLIKNESIVAIMLPRNSHHVYVAELAVLKAGGAYTCIDPSFPAERVKFILEDSKAVCVLTSSDYDNLFDSCSVNGNQRIDVISWEKDFNGKHSFCSPKWVSENTLSYLIYTSGTTGRPKGVMIEHRNILNLVLSDIDYFKLKPSDRIVQTSSTAYDSSMEEIWLAFGVGATLVVASDEIVRSGPDFGKWLKRERISVLCPPPTLLAMGICSDPKHDLPDLHLLYVGGEPLPSDIVNTWGPGRSIENGYGPTECTVTVTRGPVFLGKKITIGQAIRGNSSWILNENLENVQTGISGELCIGGAGVTRGYLNQPKLTKEKFINHPELGRIYKTGDLAKVLDTGEIEFLGRIDSQVKIKGYRIELESIESVLGECENVFRAACKVQSGIGGSTISAFLIPANKSEIDFNQLRKKLEKKLPSYMIPSCFSCLNEFPIHPASGKLDRKSLPDIILSDFGNDQELISSRTELEKLVAEAFIKNLGCRKDVSGDENFFDLGGDSLAAAMTISTLRKNKQTELLTVRDLYENPTISGLASITHEVAEEGPSSIQDEFDQRDKGFPILVSLIQFLWIFTGIFVFANVAYFSLFYIFPFLLNLFGLIPFFFIMPVFGFLAIFIYLPMSMLFAVVMKKTLIGKYQAKQYPVWGSMYLRNWMFQQCVRIVPWGLLEGTIFKNTCLRILGMKIGKNVHIHKGVNILNGGLDLLEIGDNVTLGRDAAPRMIDYHDGKMIIGPVRIGDNCTMETRSTMSPYSSMGPNSCLTSLSMLPYGRTIPNGEVWEGVPATFKKRTEPVPKLPESASIMSPEKHGIMFILLRFLTGIVSTIPFYLLFIGPVLFWDIDAKSFIEWLFSLSADKMVLIVISVFMVIAPILSLSLQALFIRSLGKIKPGVYSRWGVPFMLIWLKDRMVEIAGNVISGTLFWPWWLRLSGMKVGKNCEISTIIDVVPELVTIGEECFFADGVYLGGPDIRQGIVECGAVRLEKNTFIGNHAIIPQGTTLPSDILLGICTVADQEKVKKGTSWFGHPAFRLPRREVIECDRSLTHNPTFYRYMVRLFWELLRFILPLFPTMVLLGWIKVVSYLSEVQSAYLFFPISVPVSVISVLLVMAFTILIMKWFLLGRVKPGQHPLWSGWCSRWDFLYVAWSAYAQKILVFFEGTLFLSWWLRAMGAKIGKRVVLGSGFAQVVDPDMLNFDDYSTVLCMFQAHSFEDRVLKVEPVWINRRSTLGNGSVLLYGADIGERTRVADNSVIMKHEKLLSQNHYVGCPTRQVESTFFI